MEIFIQTLLLGIFATAVIDVWATFSNRVLKFPRTNWSMVGRWLGHMHGGKFVHNPVSSSPKIKNENILGWLCHYFIGTVYASVYALYVYWHLGGMPTFITALLFGLLTILSPWLIMQPGLGLGFFAAKAPNPNFVRLQNFCIHSIFGVALYFVWAAINVLS